MRQHRVLQGIALSEFISFHFSEQQHDVTQIRRYLLTLVANEEQANSTFGTCVIPPPPPPSPPKASTPGSRGSTAGGDASAGTMALSSQWSFLLGLASLLLLSRS
jgi:hypothetical protein